MYKKIFNNNYKKFTKPIKSSIYPSYFFFTDSKKISDPFLIIANLPKNSAIIFREYSLEKQARKELAKKIQKQCKKYQHKFFVGKNIDLALKLKADGIHFSDFDLKAKQIFKQKNLYPNMLFSYACHNLQSFTKAQKSRFDILFLSPIFTTTSHKNKTNLGLKNLAKACKISTKPIFALGGINQKNLMQITKSGACGFGAIDFFKKYDSKNN